MEEPMIAGVAHDLTQAKITVAGVPDVPGKAAQIFSLVADQGANIDMIVQNVSGRETGTTDISFTLPKAGAEKVRAALEAASGDIGYGELTFAGDIGKISLVGSGMRTNIGVSARLFEALRDAGINIDMISTSEIRISIVVAAELVTEATRVIHSAFDLDADGEAVVYAGTGR